MNKRYFFALVALVIIAGGAYLYKNSKAPVGEVPSAVVGERNGLVKTTQQEVGTSEDIVTYGVSNLSFGFVGYGPGKSHEGTFSAVTPSKIAYNEQTKLPVAGTLVIDASTVSTGIERLDTHLCSDDFFNCTTYPQIKFTFVDAVEATDGVVQVEGDLDFNGVVKRISFPVAVQGMRVTADFLLDTTPFAFKYVGIDKNVRIKFSFDAVRE